MGWRLAGGWGLCQAAGRLPARKVRSIVGRAAAERKQKAEAYGTMAALGRKAGWAGGRCDAGMEKLGVPFGEAVGGRAGSAPDGGGFSPGSAAPG
ncbi:MAG: hypothetical protein N3E46_09055 [Gemmataceae bacterium]|nr:hypothetical protein [Gemmataceae bacterium]